MSHQSLVEKRSRKSNKYLLVGRVVNTYSGLLEILSPKVGEEWKRCRHLGPVGVKRESDNVVGGETRGTKVRTYGY